MALGVPSTNEVQYTNPESLQVKSIGGDIYSVPGTKYVQYGATTAIANTVTETSLFNVSSTTSQGFLSIPANGMTFGQTVYDSITTAGGVYRVTVLGTLGTTGTPTLTIRLALKNSAGTYTTLSTSGAVTLTAVTSPKILKVTYDLVVNTMSATGTIIAGGTILSDVQTFASVPTSTASLVLTAVQSLDVLLTWGTASASNTATIMAAYIERLA
jgi:hypothetical protein